MKLYFYILDKTKDGEPVFKTEECEAKEEYGMYVPKDKPFPKGAGSGLWKKNIGEIQGRHLLFGAVMCDLMIVLTEPNLEYAQKTFSDYIHERIQHFQKKTEQWEQRLKAVEGKRM